MPGPLLTVTIRETVKRGLLAGPLLIVGHGILEGALVISLVLGASAYLGIPAVMQFIAAGGGVFLLYMAWGMVKDAMSGKIELSVEQSCNAGDTGNSNDNDRQETNNRPGVSFPFTVPVVLRLVGTGILTSLSNPYWSLWWATLGLSYITISLKQGLSGLTSFFGGHILADLIWYSLISAVICGGRSFLRPVVYRIIVGVCGFFLFGLGVYFLRFACMIGNHSV